MKFLFVLCIFVVFFVEFATSTRCICKCCTSSGCSASTYSGSTTNSFDLSIVCSAATCNQASCSANFLGACPLIGAAGDVDSTCGATRLAKYTFMHPVPSRKNSLRNRTFRIDQELYTLLGPKGSGKFGSVWEAVTPNGEYAAVKVYDFHRRGRNINSAQIGQSFEAEVRMAYAMRHETNFAVTMYGFDFDPDQRLGFMAMELGDDSLKDRAQYLHQIRVDSGKPGYDYISAADRKYIWVQLVDIILALHRHRIIHRDMKPSNLVFFGPTMKIVDFGLAQKEFQAHPRHQRLIGAISYSAPECLTGEAPITTKADIWSVGAILYFLTYGVKPPYWTAQPPSGLPPTRSTLVQDVIHRCLQRNLYRRADQSWLAQHPLTSDSTTV
ncbi:unnamed protein product [Adineta steineri]|uniref:Protein kinase domain-containing protein n=1 Tax=Adineta steineri TaxID=433720 RepID=A0A818Z6M7_9BILA|nr:unnamed protein product [Adineta steineri]